MVAMVPLMELGMSPVEKSMSAVMPLASKMVCPPYLTEPGPRRMEVREMGMA